MNNTKSYNGTSKGKGPRGGSPKPKGKGGGVGGKMKGGKHGKPC